MQTTLSKTLCMGFATLALVACARHRTDANHPAGTTTTTGATTGVTTWQGTTSPGDPGGITPRNSGVTVTSGAPASPMEGSCPSGQPSPYARDLSSCTRSCRGLDSATPSGSICFSAYDRCMIDCRQSFASEKP